MSVPVGTACGADNFMYVAKPVLKDKTVARVNLVLNEGTRAGKGEPLTWALPGGDVEIVVLEVTNGAVTMDGGLVRRKAQSVSWKLMPVDGLKVVNTSAANPIYLQGTEGKNITLSGKFFLDASPYALANLEDKLGVGVVGKPPKRVPVAVISSRGGLKPLDSKTFVLKYEEVYRYNRDRYEKRASGDKTPMVKQASSVKLLENTIVDFIYRDEKQLTLDTSEPLDANLARLCQLEYVMAKKERGYATSPVDDPAIGSIEYGINVHIIED